MSIEVMRYVWNNSKSKANNRLMLLAIADIANDTGDAYPGMDRLFKKCNISRRKAQDCIQELERVGELQVFENVGTKTKSGWTNLYRVVMADVKPSEVRAPDGSIVTARPIKDKRTRAFPKAVQTVAPLSNSHSENKAVQTAAPHDVQTAAPHDVQTAAPESSVYTTEERSESNTILSAVSADIEIPNPKPSDTPNPIEEKTDAVKQAEEYVKAIESKNLFQEAVKITFKAEFGSFNGLLVNFLTGSKKNKGKWKEWQINAPPMIPGEIVAFGDWYATDYKKAWESNQKKPPMTPETLGPRVMEFRAQSNYQQWVNKSTVAFMELMGATPAPAKVAEAAPQPGSTTPTNLDQLAKYDAIIAALANGESIDELIST